MFFQSLFSVKFHDLLLLVTLVCKYFAQRLNSKRSRFFYDIHMLFTPAHVIYVYSIAAAKPRICPKSAAYFPLYCIHIYICLSICVYIYIYYFPPAEDVTHIMKKRPVVNCILLPRSVHIQYGDLNKIATIVAFYSNFFSEKVLNLISDFDEVRP